MTEDVSQPFVDKLTGRGSLKREVIGLLPGWTLADFFTACVSSNERASGVWVSTIKNPPNNLIYLQQFPYQQPETNTMEK